MTCTELQRLRRELQQLIEVEEREIEVLRMATGPIATTSIRIRGELVHKIRRVLGAETR